MAIGNRLEKQDIDFKVGALAVQLRNVLNDIREFNYKVSALTDPVLTDMGCSTEDIDRLRGGMNDLDKLGGIYRGEETQAVAYDFRVFSKWFTGAQ